jgi:hypothetical protein
MNQTAPHWLWGTYEAFLDNEFRTAAEEAGKDVKFDRPIASCFSRLSKEKTEFKRCLYLKGWPCKNLGPSKRLDIIVKILETFTTSEWSLVKSTVYLNYLVVSNSIAHLAQSLHYDFVAGGQLDHPLFHVQLTLEPIQESDLLNEGFYDKLKLPRGRECWVTTRIPTPDMTFPSVLYCLVADHLGAGIFKKFSENVDSMLKDRLPAPNCDRLQASLRKSTSHFKSSHWFAHNP